MKRLCVFLASVVFVGMNFLQAQTVQITGTVSSAEDGMPIPGASVLVKGTSIGVATDIDGKYSITVPTSATALEFSFIGMLTQEVAILGRTVIDVVLQSDATELEEVIVVAYGTSKRSSFTGSASSVGSEKIEKIQASDITKVLEGMSSGIQTTSGLGQPGATADVRIRGINSINASASPLYVVDGFPYSGNINTIPPSDIESMTVLKDASATALYGSRGANGVIVITTKKGKKDQTNFNFRSNVGVSSRGIPEYERVNTAQYYETSWMGIKNWAATLVPWTDEQLSAFATAQLVPSLGYYNAYDVPDDELVVDGKINPNANLLWTDSWYDELHRTGVRQDYVLSASGGTDKSNYFFSASYLNDEGIVKASQFDRYSIRLNAESQMRDWVKVGMGIGGSSSSQNFPQSSGTAYVNSFMFSRMIAPIYPVYQYNLDGTPNLDADGNKIPDYGAYAGRVRRYASNVNPLGTITLDTRKYNRDALTTRGFVEFSFLQDFKFIVNASTDYYAYTGLTHQNSAYGDARSFAGRSTRTVEKTMNFAANQILTWNKSFDDHNFEATAIHESTQYQFNYLSAVRTGFAFIGLTELDAAAVPEGSNSYEHNHRMESYAARLNYDFADRYYLSASFRTDGSSRFQEANRWGTFWSIGGSWRLSEEAFMQDFSWLNNMNVRASYGALGNESLSSYYAYLGLYSAGWDNLGFPGLLASRLETTDLTWEKNNTLNLGVDFRVFNRLTFNFEYYIKTTDGLLFPMPMALSTGFNSFDANIGKMQNRGIDIELNANIIKGQNFTWNVDVMFSHFKNEILELPQEEILSGNKKWMVGQSVYDYFIQSYAGLDDTGRPMWYTDVVTGQDDNGDPIVEKETTTNYNLASRYYVGTAIPDFEGSFTNSFAIGGVDFSFMLTYGVGGLVYDGVYQGLMHNQQSYGTNWHIDILDSWTPDNTDTDVPILEHNQNYNAQSDRWLVGRDYLSLRNVQIGYTLPKSVVSSMGISDIRVFATGTNLYTFTKRQGLNPTQSFAGGQGHEYTPIRTVAFGLSMNF